MDVVRHVVRPFHPSASRTVAGRTHYQVVRQHQGVATCALYEDGEVAGWGRSVAELMGALSAKINQAVIGTSVEDRVLLHAAAATFAGVTVVLAADMECGKSTTVAGLLRAGFDYVTDEAVAIDLETAWVSSFPKRVGLDPGSWRLFEDCRPGPEWELSAQWYVAPEELGSRASSAHVPPAKVVVLPRYVAGAGTTWTGISRAEAVHGLALTTFDFRARAARNLTTLARVVAPAVCGRLIIGDLDEAVTIIKNLVHSLQEDA